MAEADAAAARPVLPADLRLRRNRAVALTVAFLVFVFDQATKWVVTYPLNLAGQPDRTIGITSFFVYYLHYSPYGNWIFAMGGDKDSARNVGIPTSRMTVLLFIFSAVCASFVGVSQAILFQSVQATPQMTLIFNTIISVVVGGVLLTGGFGSVVGIFLGTITFAVVNQGIYYTGFDQSWSNLIIGILLLVAVLMNNTFRRMALTYSPKRVG